MVAISLGNWPLEVFYGLETLAGREIRLDFFSDMLAFRAFFAIYSAPPAFSSSMILQMNFRLMPL
jgi:hypothetical protein